ncbi:exodeoxyribonuclease III [Zymomonas mobilis]|uniref:Exodeoxyribonuclease III Xth n=1 Tax=Zymomonas mobilis subsp. pomaceae (strain ATCC 29192 / DSM 22645 / JCM 10191 / CCUG 17912 / NBRC 13757 / NCIMB 11200 / NRRL B-4491 / Barker I) TaxID=579138 RepID=F8EWE3_ZYMMT|nr:exodeoxyribonuclease III [Zymomonas mobilis]AEI38553.1 exodeoxyribonuclease III Xth [Zymomonas mobilis subsp. pomaceae ATCC 29192]MDX5948243.1 exodeoxyribonuclease III [Zymomonas mobilis subsp. pomaceae]GEB88998.1 exodeoxyribonuclease III [Zymomonas mobilis subsp. pomaceae]
MLTVASFNVNGINARLPRLTEWLVKFQPDIVCLQEIKAAEDRFPREEIEAIGYNCLFHGQKSFNGVTILTKKAIPQLIRNQLPNDPDPLQCRYLEAEVNGIIIVSLYLPNGNPLPSPKYDYKLAWFKAFVTHAQTLWNSEKPVILAGDYNVVPSSDFKDIRDASELEGNALISPESRFFWRELLAMGWTDAIRARYPNEPLYSFWDYQGRSWPKDHGMRIDHLLISPAIADRLMDVGIDRTMRGLEKSSDHVPVWLRLRD